MTDTIPNVPRELLADLLGNDHDKRIMAERHLLAMLANAPSPAGVDGLEVVGWYTEDHLDDKSATTYSREVADRWLAKGWTVNGIANAAAAQTIIDGLRVDVEVMTQHANNYSRMFEECAEERDQQAQRIGELASHLEFAVTMLTVAGLAGNAQVAAMRAALSAGKDSDK